MNSSQLLGHLLHEHGPSRPEVDGLPPADLHRFEHVEQTVGPISLGHRHAADGSEQRLDQPRP